MTAFKIPQPWATNDDYASGPDVGTPTKVDPDSEANGFVRGQAAAAQHINHLFNGVSGAGARAIACDALCLRRVTLDGETIDDTSNFIAAACVGEGHRIVAVKVNTNGVMTLGDADIFGLGSTVTSITNARDADVNLATGRILVVGEGGNRCSFSDNSGGTWTTGGNLTETRTAVVYDAVNGNFIAFGVGDPDAYRSTDGVAWASANIGGGAVAGNSVGVTDAGLTFVNGRVSSDGGATWAAFTSDPSGWVTGPVTLGGRGGRVVCTAKVFGAPNRLLIATTEDSASWSNAPDISPPSDTEFTGVVRILADALNPSAFVVLAVLDSGMTAAYLSADEGVSWTKAAYYPDMLVTQFAFAGGKLIATEAAALFASDGIGV